IRAEAEIVVHGDCDGFSRCAGSSLFRSFFFLSGLFCNWCSCTSLNDDEIADHSALLMASHGANEVVALANGGVLWINIVVRSTVVQQLSAYSKIITVQFMLHEDFFDHGDCPARRSFDLIRAEAEVVVHGDCN